MKQKIFLVMLLAGLMFLPRTQADPAAPPDNDLIEELKLFSKALGVINQAFVSEVSPRLLLYEAVKGMMLSLGDKNTEFIEPARYELLKIHMRGEYAGIGAILQLVDKYPAIRAIQPGSAAEKAGLQAADRIIKINGSSMENKPLPDVAALLRGDPNTTVTLSILREPGKQPFDVVVSRQKIELVAVQDTRMIGKGIGYLRISDFQEHTVEQADKSIKTLKEQGMKALIIDLRGNGGGLMPKAVELAERFLPKGNKIVSINSKIEEQRKDYFSSGDKTLAADLKLIVLVNHDSASASEIFSAAMQDYARAVIIGTQTFGKASAQAVIPLDDYSAMKLTTAKYVTPKGRMIDGKGITPDHVVENGDPSVPGSDNQMLKAIEVLKDFM